MEQTVKQMNIYQAISKCMEDIRAVGKNDVNKTQGFKYRGIDAIMNALNPALVKNHIFIVPEVLEQIREERKTSKGSVLIYSVCKIRYTFYAEDGSCITAVTVGEGMDSGDKATNKAMAIAFKYACFQVFCIPTEEMTDPDSESQELAKKPQFTLATEEQLCKMNEFIDSYAELCENAKSDDVWERLKSRYHFQSVDKISMELADKIILQVKAWYEKKKEAEN